jgi:hypothetical protein
MPKALRMVVALSVTVLLLVALAGLAAQAGSFAPTTSLVADGSSPVQVGDAAAMDPVTGLPPEDPPYTQAEPIFNPQLAQAPVKDSLTWNPVFMSEFETFDQNYELGLYNQILAGSLNATEKVWFRQWYEPWHWDKDWNANGTLDLNPQVQIPYTLTKGTRYDEWYPAVMQEFTYMLLDAKRVQDKPEPLAGPVGQTSFVFPVGVSVDELYATGTSPGYGLTSLDGNLDGLPDIVHVESEVTLFDLTGIAADFNGNGAIDTLDTDSTELNGNELAVLRLDSMALYVGQVIQFLDHYVRVQEFFNDRVLLEVWYTGDTTPVRLGTAMLYYDHSANRGDMLLSGRNGPGQVIKAVANGGAGTNMCDFPTGPWFVYLDGLDTSEMRAQLIVGRALGATWSGMESGAGQPDVRPGDPWFLKRFYVDGHEYNVVAIKTEQGAATTVPRQLCDLDADNDKEIDAGLWPPQPDPTLFKFITIRTPVPKTSPYEENDALRGYLIEQHSVRLQAYSPITGTFPLLSVMPPYNLPHYVLLDVQPLTATNTVTGTCPTSCYTATNRGLTCREDDVPYFGKLVGPVSGVTADYYYVDENKNWQLLGELKEKYGDHAQDEFWYVEQFQTLPWAYTEFVLPNLDPGITGVDNPDLYLLTSAWLAPQSEGVLWTQDVAATSASMYHVRWDSAAGCWVRDDSSSQMPAGWKPRLKFWFDPAAVSAPWKYKSAQGIRIYGMDGEGPGDSSVTDPGSRSLAVKYPVEIWPYTDSWAPFNPQLPQAPPKDSLTFDPAYMDKYNHGEGDPLADLYAQLSINEHDAREKVFLRMWYEPEYLDKILRLSTSPPYAPTTVYTFPAVMQEFTYMYVDTMDQPAHAQPGSSTFVFPMATGLGELPLPPAPVSLGYGLTSFDADFDGTQDVVHLHSEVSLSKVTGINADFNGDGMLSGLDKDGAALTGDELVIFALEEKVLRRGQSLQFLDHAITLDNVSASSGGVGAGEFQFWYTGGGLHPAGSIYSLHPDAIGGVLTIPAGKMAIANKTTKKLLPSFGNLGGVDGAWFVYVTAVDSTTGDEKVSVIVGRALGATHSAMDNASGGHDLVPGDPWYLKRFFVDGHEYNVVAIYTTRAANPNPGDENYEFKYITIRTPVPKVTFVNYEDSQVLQGYGPVTGVQPISVMPPFNFRHTEVDDIQALPEKTAEAFTFGNASLQNEDCYGQVFTLTASIKALMPPHEISIVTETVEPQFFGELKEMYFDNERQQVWQTEQWHSLPDQYTELNIPIFQLPDGQRRLYLLTSDWESEQSRVYLYGCPDITQNDLHAWNVAIPATNKTITETQQQFFQANASQRLRVKFLYDPMDPEDIYVNRVASGPDGGVVTLRTYGSGMHSVRGAVSPGPTPTRTPTTVPTPTRTATPIPGTTGTITGTVKLQGRTNHSGATVSAGGVSTTTGSDGRFTLTGVPPGTHTVRASMTGYLYSEKVGVAVTAGGTVGVPPVQLLGGDACSMLFGPPDCKVDLFDLVLLGKFYGSSPPTDVRADLNGNGAVDIYDLVMVGLNLNKVCPAPWAAPSASSLDVVPPANLRVIPAHGQFAVDAVFTATIVAEDVTNLYGADINVQFAPGVLEVLDQNPLVEGVQILSGDLLYPDDPTQVGMNQADNQNGTIRYAVTLAEPRPAANGTGAVCSIVFHTKGPGLSAVDLVSATLMTKDLSVIPLTLYDGTVHVGSLIHLPLILKSEPH